MVLDLKSLFRINDNIELRALEIFCVRIGVNNSGGFSIMIILFNKSSLLYFFRSNNESSSDLSYEIMILKSSNNKTNCLIFSKTSGKYLPQL